MKGSFEMESSRVKRIVSLVLSAAVLISVFCTMGIVSNAASYSSVVLNVPRISQKPNTGDCAIASISSVEAYFYNLPSGDYTSEAYQAVYSANDYSLSAMWPSLGYKSYSGFDMQTAYDQLNSGYPVIVHRTSSHYSVIYGYNGNTSALALSGFLIFDVDDSYTNSTSKKTLDVWRGKYSLDQMVLRQNGLAIPTINLKITGNHPYPYHIKGNTFSVFGTVVSRYNITSLTMSIKDSSGAVAQGSTYSASPNAKSFAISNGDSKMYFSKLTAGSYKYSVTAKDSSGASATYSYDFKVIANGSDLPNNDNENEIVYTSYTAVVTADPSLNLRSGAGTEYSVLASIPYGTGITVTAESKGWGQVTYGGKTGWVSLEYIKETVSSSLYVRTTVKTSVKSAASSSASTVTTVPANTILLATEKSGSWIKIKYSGKTGWISIGNCVEGIGDVNGNGKLDSADALLVLQYSTGTKSFTSLQKQLADMNGDGKVNSADSLLILRTSTGSI